MKILLIEPPFYRLYHEDFSLDKFPLSLGYLSSFLLQRSLHEILIYNADFHAHSKPMFNEFLAGVGFDNFIKNIQNDEYVVWQEIKKTIKDFQPDIVGITAKSQNYKSAIKVAEIIKSINRKTIVVIGGPHPSLVKSVSLENLCVDIAVIGEGEVTFYELVNAISTGTPLKGISGLVFRNGDDIFENNERPYIQDLIELPNPYLNVKNILKDFNFYPTNAFRSVFATRGCPFNCTFCGSHAIWSRKVRFRPVDHVINEIQFLRDLGSKYINFDDDTFGVTKSYLIELCRAIEMKCKGLFWSCEIHVKLIDDEVLLAMKKAGCDLIKIGIESGNNKILKEINKHITIEEAINAAHRIHKAGLHVMTFFMVGFPQETEDSLIDTLWAIKKIKGYATYSIFTPYIGTVAFEECRSMGMIPSDFDVSKYNHQSPNNSFSQNIPHDKFRLLASEIEKEVDEKNLKYERFIRLKRYAPSNVIKKILSRIRISFWKRKKS